MKDVISAYNSSAIPENELKNLNLKLLAIRNMNQLIYRDKKINWKLKDLCNTLTETGGYLSCRIALTNEAGDISEIAESDLANHRRYDSKTISIDNFKKFITDSINKHEPKMYNDESSDLGTIISKIEYNNKIYGFISVTVRKGIDKKNHEHILLNEAAKDIAFELYSIEIATSQFELEKKIKESEKFYRSIFETTENATMFFEEDTTISLANHEFEKLSGYSKEEIEGKKSWTEFISPEDLPMMQGYHNERRIDPDSAPRNYKFRFIDKYKNHKDIFMTIGMIPGTMKSIASLMNITEHKRLENEIIRISEIERQQLSSDIHDGLGPHLVGIKFMTNILEEKLNKLSIPESKDIKKINLLISEAIEHSKKLAKGLCPVDIDSDGLVVALEELTSNTKNIYSVSCDFKHDDKISISDSIAATHLYLIAREAINNAIKHSNSSKLNIILQKNDNSILLSISDNGTGIPKLLDQKSGMGINIMKYRARMINSNIIIENNNNGGTSVICIYKNK